MIDVLVVSLPESLERRAKSEFQLNQSGVRFDFIDAIRGGTDHPLLAKFSQKKFILRNRRKAVDGEVGCYASHYLAWLRCVELDRPVVILEDDVELLERAQEFFSVAEAIAERFPLVKLEVPSKQKRCRPPISVEGFEISECIKVNACCIAYMATPLAAKALINGSKEFKYPVDVFIRNVGLHGLSVHTLCPAIADRGVYNKQSEIGDRSRYVGLWAHIPRQCFRFANAIANRWVGKYI